MKPKIFFKIGSIICSVLFYLILLLAVFILLEYGSRLWMPGSALAESFGSFAPTIAYIDIIFDQQPDIYTEQSIVVISFISSITALLLMLLFLWYMRKLLKNIYKDSLFMYENVSIILKLGISIMVLGSAFTYTDGLLLSKALTALDVSNGEVTFSNISYVDTVIGGGILMIIASALKIAVNAVEENKKTI
ncbi:signal transduction histidine kinase [Salibacterium salarium]|uniref:DUF2975 domain-containing protein n=1 Tax=Salibacterium salarium TaxID=284579 RepID=UPI0027896AE7|nr:DUF2975 domain-containing protein [Salibacterium salarium]MDQ0298469.1 signal transduction histidine kinase [Salibacterium salarium]